MSLGVAPDKDLATPIPTEQNAGSGARRLPALQTCAIQHLPRRKEGGGLRQPRTRSSGITARTPKQAGSLESASRSILPHPVGCTPFAVPQRDTPLQDWEEWETQVGDESTSPIH